ncbi:hypothetical protein [Methylobacterium sp. D54C]
MNISDRPITYPERLRIRIEDGLSGAITRAARQNRTTASEFVRQAVRLKLVSDGVSLPDLSGRDAA